MAHGDFVYWHYSSCIHYSSDFSLFRIEVDLTFIAAVLTIVGYSINDTIVTFDRVRENYKRLK